MRALAFIIVFALPLSAQARPPVQCKTPEILASLKSGVHLAGGRPGTCANCRVCSTSLPLCVHWGTSGYAAKADVVLGLAEQSWAVEVDQLGFRAPPPDAGMGGGDELDIYLAPIGAYEAYVLPESGEPATEWADSTSHVVIDQDLPAEWLDSYVAHELHHTMQFAYDSIEADSPYEATSTFMEDQVFDADNGYIETLSDFQDYPEVALDYATYLDWYMYGASIFLFYLSQRFDDGGAAFVRDMWEESRQTSASTNEPDYFDALETLLASRGMTLTDAYLELCTWRLLTAEHAHPDSFEEGATWPGVWIQETLALQSAAEIAPEYPPMELGANYYGIDTTNGLDGDRLEVSLDSSSSKTWALTLVGIDAAGDVHTETSTGKRVGIDDVSHYTKLFLHVANLGNGSRDPDDLNYATSDYTISLHYAADGVTFDEADAPRGCACTVAAKPAPRTAFPMAFALLAGLWVSWRRRMRAPH